LDIENELFFSKNYRYKDLEWDNEKLIIDAFKDRIDTFFIEPAEKLTDKKYYGFMLGLICMATIDYISRFEYENIGKKRLEVWLENNIPKFNDKDETIPSRNLSRRFYNDFRNGLSHNGMIKNGGHFFYGVDLIIQKDGFMVVNPRLLLKEIKKFVKKFIKELGNNPEKYINFKRILREDHRKDLRKIKENEIFS